jgi:hypothetical protein
MRLRAWLGAAAALVVTASAAPAAAQDQPWLADRKYTVGPGFRVGDFELHPGLAAEFGYDSNFLRRADTEDPIGSLRLRLTPSFSVSSLGGQRAGGGQPDVTFDAGLALTYNEFIPVSGGAEGQRLLQDSRSVGGVAKLGVKFAPGRSVFGEVSAEASRIFQPSQQGIDIGFNRWVVGASAEVGWASRGRTIELRGGYRFQGTIFEQTSSLSNVNNAATVKGLWKFFPRTSLMFDGSVGFINYLDPTAGGTLAGGSVKTGSTPVRARAGFNGLITDWLQVLALVGWGSSFYSEPAGSTPFPDFDSVIAQVETKFFLTPNPAADPKRATLSVSALNLGFSRDFYDAFLSSYAERNRGYLSLSYFYSGALLVSVEGGAAALTYPGNPGIAGLDAAWTDIAVDASAYAEYRFKDWIGVNATVRYTTNISDRTITIDGPDSLQWQQFEGYAGLRLLY